jgi:hypothetical protein
MTGVAPRRCWHPGDFSDRPKPKGGSMKQISLTIPEIGLIAGTRAAGAAGLALLLSDRLTPERRRSIGWTLLAIGLISTVPLAADVFGKYQASSNAEDA